MTRGASPRHGAPGSVPAAGTAEQVALAMSAAEIAQYVRLLARFDALGDRLDAEVVAKLDDTVHDGGSALFAGDRADEAPVDLHGADRQVAEHRKRRVPGAKIVEGYRHAHLRHFVQLPQDGRRRLDQGRLGDLEVQVGRVEIAHGQSTPNWRPQLAR